MAMLFIYLSTILKIRFWYGMCMCVGGGGRKRYHVSGEH